MSSVVEAMVVLHATDPATVYLSALARLTEPSIDLVADALYEDRTLARVLAMRRTLFVAKVDHLDIVERSSTDSVAAKERKRLVKFLGESGIDDPTQWLADAVAEVSEAFASVGAEGAPARKITSLVPRLATKIVMGAGTKHTATVGATSRVIAVLANEGLLMRGRPAGQWTGRQYAWHLRTGWLAGHPGTSGELSTAEASSQLVRRWLQSFGPGTFDDLKWWTGWNVGQLKAALAALDVTRVHMESGDGETSEALVLTDDLADDPDPGPWAALLPSLDPTPMGWKDRAWYLGPHKGALFDRFGNIGPTVWVGGRIVGGWAQQSGGRIVTELLEDVDDAHRSLIEEEVSSLQTAIGATVIKPSFPTPLQRQLTE